MKYKNIWMTIVILFCLVLTLHLYLKRNNDMYLTNKLNDLDPKILKEYSLDFLKGKLDVDTATHDLENQIQNHEHNNLKEIERLMSEIGLSDTDSWLTLKNVLDTKCKEQFGFSMDSDEFLSFFHANFISDGDTLTRREIENSPFLLSLEFYQECLRDIGSDINEKSSIRDILNRGMKKYRYERFIKPYIDEKTRGVTSKALSPIMTLAIGGPKSPINGKKAQAYAEKWANGHNRYYQHLGENDCTNFVSQCLFNGELVMTYESGQENKSGIVEDKKHWFYIPNKSSHGYAMSTSWIRVNEIKEYLGKTCASGINNDPEDVKKYLQPGFVLLGRNPGWFKSPWQHAVLVTKKNGMFCFCGHSNNRRNEPLKTFTDNFKEYWVIQTY